MATRISTFQIRATPGIPKRHLVGSLLSPIVLDDPNLYRASYIVEETSTEVKDMQPWLEAVMYIWFFFTVLSFMIMIVDIRGKSVGMPIMRIVWPLTTLYMGIIGLYAYWRLGRNTPMMHHSHHDEHDHTQSMSGTHSSHGHPREETGHHGKSEHEKMHHHMHYPKKPFWQSVFVSSTHCGGGCALGDAIGGPVVFALGLVVSGSSLFADYIVEFVLAFIFGIAFQYFGMGVSNLESLGKGLKNAIKADTWSLIAYEIGMFGWMALVHVFYIHVPNPTNPVYWFMMQIAMMLGFITSYPANWILVRKGIKHAM